MVTHSYYIKFSVFSASFDIYYCVINSASINALDCSNGCDVGNHIQLNATLTGDCSRYGINFLQIDADSNIHGIEKRLRC